MDAQTMLMMQMLMGTGQDLMAYGANTDKGLQFNNLNAAMNQTAQTAMMMKMLGPGGFKGSFSDKGLNITIPPEEAARLFGRGSGLETEGIYEGMPKGLNLKGQGGGQTNVASPFESESVKQPSNEIDLASAAFLTPENIATIAGIKGQQDALENKRVNDVVDMMYKGALIRDIESNISAKTPIVDIPGADIKLTAKEYLDYSKENIPFPVEIPDVGEVTTKTWSTMPEDVKRYAVYVHGAKKSGKIIKSKEEFEAMKPTDQENLLRVYMKYPELKKVAIEIKRAGAPSINIGAKVEEARKTKEAVGGEEQKLKVTDPGFFLSLKTTVLKDPDNEYPIAEAKALMQKYPQLSLTKALELAKKIKVREEFHKQVISVFPNAVKTGGGNYKLPNGKIIHGE